MNAEPSFGMVAKNRRRELGLTQDELARRVGCAPITLRKIEANDLRPSVQIAERMAMALNIPLEERAAFVKLARAEHVPVEEPIATSMPTPEEIGIEDLSGRAIRGYALGERLGNGGMGVVYRAVQPLVEREVAIKIILPKYANHPDFIRRFEAEAQLVARLEHPHIVPLYDYWREPSVAYLIMRLLRGGSVQSLLRNETVLSPEIVLRMMEQIGSALSAAHRAGVVHRDLKPANVLLDEDSNAYLADFGIAKNLSNPTSETQADAVIGSPDYISPEQIRSEYVRPQTDIYALGVMLYELLTGKLPFQGPTPFDVMHQHLSAPLPPLAANRAGLPKALDDVIGHATSKDPLRRYENVDLMLDDLHKALGISLRGLESGATTSEQVVVSFAEIENPYKGLRAFGEGDAQDFFGRDALTQQLLVRLGEGGELARFLAVVGPSGSGKSSVVKAGLIPALRRGALPRSENWFIIEMTPGSHPLEELEAALLRVAVNPPASLIEQFQNDNRGLIRAVRRSLPDDPNIELVLVIDQFEEVFTLLQDEKKRLQFLGLLVSAILDENSRIRVVLTLRADFIDRPLGYVDFGELLHQRMEIVLPLTPDELESTIVSPAQRVGLRFEPGLVPAILHDLGDQPGTLPLLQYSLTELYEKREGDTLTKSAYQEIGGVIGALGRRAEDVFTKLDSRSQTIAKQLFLRLVTLGEGVEDTRRRTLIAELEKLQFDDMTVKQDFSASLQQVLDAFGRARMLSFDRDPETRGPTVEVAHEAILREWKRLREWLNESRALVRMQRQLAQAAYEWLEADREISFLLTGAKLAQYEGWTTNSEIALTLQEINYLNASIEERDRREKEEAERQRRELETAKKLAETEKKRAEEQLRSNKRLRQRAIFLTAAFVMAGILALTAGIFWRNSVQSTRLATSRELSAAAVNNLQIDPERSVLLALQALETFDILEARNALHQAIPEMHLLKTIFVSSGGVPAVAYSPDGRLIASMSVRQEVKLWDVNSGELLRTFVGADETSSSIAFSPDGSILAGAYTTQVVLWDTASGEIMTILSGGSQEGVAGYNVGVGQISFSPDGKYLATANMDGVSTVWDIGTSSKVLSLMAAETLPPKAIDYSPDGKLLANGGDEGYVHVWDAKQGTELFSRELGGIIHALSFSPDANYLSAASEDGSIKVWNAVTGEVVSSPPRQSGMYDIDFLADGRYATAGQDGTTRVWDPLTGQQVLLLAGPNSTVISVDGSPDSKRIITGAYDGSLRIWDATPGKELTTIPAHTGIVWDVAHSPDGKRLASASVDGTVKVWDASTGALLLSISGAEETAGGFVSVAYSPDGKLIAAGNMAGRITIWDSQSGEIVTSLSGHKTMAVDLAFSPDGRRLATASWDGTAKVWDLTNQEVLTISVTVPGYWITSIVFSPDGKTIFTGTDEKCVRQWDAATVQEIRSFSSDGVEIYGVAVSPDGNLLAASDQGGTIHVWDVKTGEKLHVLTGHAGLGLRVTFSNDGTHLASVSFDRLAKVWDVNTGKELASLYGNASNVYGASFSPDGNQLATAGADGTVRIYTLRLEDLISLARSRLTRSLTSEECEKYLHVELCPSLP